MDEFLMLQPMHDTVVVKPDPKVRHAFLVMPEEDSNTGTVVAVGPGKRRDNGKREYMWVKAGDRVRYSGSIDMEHVGLHIMKRNDLIGLIDG